MFRHLVNASVLWRMIYSLDFSQKLFILNVVERILNVVERG